jgi:hypothetical protein
VTAILRRHNNTGRKFLQNGAPIKWNVQINAIEFFSQLPARSESTGVQPMPTLKSPRQPPAGRILPGEVRQQSTEGVL